MAADRMLKTLPGARWFAALTLLTALVACGEEEPARPQCYFNGDCIVSGEICDRAKGLCVKTSSRCANDTQCAPNQQCLLPQGVCALRPVPKDMAQDMIPADMTSTPDAPQDMPKTNNDPGDKTSPQVSAITPAPLGPPIALDQQFTITFSERMDPLSISEFSIVLESGQGAKVPTQVTFDNNLTATVKPTQPLAPATPYKLTVNQFARDLNLNVLDKETSALYVTPYEAPARQEQLARDWAPLIYQGIDDLVGFQWRGDVPSSVDFDGDFKAANNKSSMLLGTVDYRARVYYHVTESATHLFLYYVLYYPQRKLRDDATGQDVVYEHDMTGAVFVVEKATDKLVIVEGLRVEEQSDTLISYTLSGSGYDAPGESIRARFGASDLEGKRYPLYIPAKRHESCNFNDDAPRPPLDICSHNKRAFPGGADKGVLMTPGMMGQRLDDAMMGPSGFKEMTYELIPLASLFWLRRNEYGPDALFERAFVYKPDGEGRPKGFDDETPHLLPNELISADMRSFGKSPFRWLFKSSTNNPGQWMLDPAYELRQRYSVGGDWSQEYCYNMFFNINRTDLQGCAP